MIKLEDKSNVNAPTSAYPFGSLRDNPGDNTGTPVNVELLSDTMQLMEKIMAESGIAPNGLPDNATNGFQLFQALKQVMRPYKLYVAFITQTGTSAPVATTIFNDIPGTMSFTRTSAGDYTINNSSNAFTANKTVPEISRGSNPSNYASVAPNTTSNCVIIGMDATTGIPGDNNISELVLRIEVYY